MDIIPFERVGAVAFGMTSEDVERTLGPPRVKMKNFLGEAAFLYGGLNIDFDENGAADITLAPSQQVMILGHSISNDKNGWDTLLALSKERFRGDGSIILLDIGIAISDDEESPFPLTAFARGRPDPRLTTYERV